jgi:hypothetical protein
LYEHCVVMWFFCVQCFPSLKLGWYIITYSHCSITKLGKRKHAKILTTLFNWCEPTWLCQIYEQAETTDKNSQTYKETTLLKNRKNQQKSNDETPKKITPKNNKMLFFKKLEYALFHVTLKKFILWNFGVQEE